MQPTLRLVRAATLLVTLAAPGAAWAQGSPWPLPPPAPTAHGVPAWHAPRAPYAADDEATPRSTAMMALPREVAPISAGRVVTQVGVGALGVLGGGFLGALGGIPLALADSERGFFATMYLGASLAVAGTVTGIGRAFDGDGNFGATLLGSGLGALAGWGFQFWAFERSDRSWTVTPMVLTGALTLAGGIVGYSLSASSARDIDDARSDRARLAPMFQPLRDGAALGVAGSF